MLLVYIPDRETSEKLTIIVMCIKSIFIAISIWISLEILKLSKNYHSLTRSLILLRIISVSVVVHDRHPIHQLCVDPVSYKKEPSFVRNKRKLFLNITSPTCSVGYYTMDNLGKRQMADTKALLR